MSYIYWKFACTCLFIVGIQWNPGGIGRSEHKQTTKEPFDYGLAAEWRGHVEGFGFHPPGQRFRTLHPPPTRSLLVQDTGKIYCLCI